MLNLTYLVKNGYNEYHESEVLETEWQKLAVDVM